MVCADGVMLHSYCMPGGPYGGYNLGNTGVHETGDWRSAVWCYVVSIQASGAPPSRGIRGFCSADSCADCGIPCTGSPTFCTLIPGTLLAYTGCLVDARPQSLLADLTCAQINTALLAAGHYFGLLHTFEPAGHADGCEVALQSASDALQSACDLPVPCAAPRFMKLINAAWSGAVHVHRDC